LDHEIAQLVELPAVGVHDAPLLLAVGDQQPHEIDLAPGDSTAARARAGKPGGTVASGAKVKVSDRPARAASAKTWSQNCSRSRTNGSLPKGNTVVRASTTRWLWKTG
jgi:hypothetical protein